MRSASGIAIALLLVACSSKSDPPPPEGKPAPRKPRPDAAGAATPTPTPTPSIADASVAVAAPVDASIDDVPATPVPSTPITDLTSLAVWADPGARLPKGKVIVHAADADASWLRMLLGEGSNYVELTPATSTVTGQIGPTSYPGAMAALIDAAPTLAIHPRKRSKGTEVSMQFQRASVANLIRFAANIARQNYVLSIEVPTTIDLAVDRFGVAGLIEALMDVLGLEVDHHGTVHWVRRPDGPRLDPALVKTHKQKVSIDAVAARAGELYALLGALGVDAGGAACDVGSPVTLRISDAPAGAALAVIAALSGTPPVTGTTCAAPIALPDPLDVGELELVAVARTGTNRRTVLRVGTQPLVVTRAGALTEIGDTFVTFSFEDGREIAVTLYPSDLGDPTSINPSMLGRIEASRLAATIVVGDGGTALFEHPDGSWWTLDVNRARRLEHDLMGMRLEPGKLILLETGLDGLVKDREVLLSARTGSPPPGP